MLGHTFVHLPTFDRLREARLWGVGVTTLEGLRRALDRVEDASALWLLEAVEATRSALRRGDAAFFQRALPPGERWRMLADFRGRAVCLDIETTGFRGSGVITVIGVYDGHRYRAFVRGRNLDAFPAFIRRFSLVITYNGDRFDIPFVEDRFPGVFRGLAHLDLRWPLRRLGYKGGLKRIEEALGLARPSPLRGLQGRHAVLLWYLHRRGHRGALPTLLRYNAEDVAVLWPMAHRVYNGMLARLARESAGWGLCPRCLEALEGGTPPPEGLLPQEVCLRCGSAPPGVVPPVPPLEVPERPEVDLPYDPGLVEWLTAHIP